MLEGGTTVTDGTLLIHVDFPVTAIMSAETIVDRADHKEPNMGIQGFEGDKDIESYRPYLKCGVEPEY